MRPDLEISFMTSSILARSNNGIVGNNKINEQTQNASQDVESAKNASQSVIRHGTSMPPKKLTKQSDTEETSQGK